MVVTALQTPNLVIRNVCASDADAFYLYMQREDYWRDLPKDPPTRDSVANTLNGWLQDQTKENRTRYCMAATDKATGKVIGEAILHVRLWRQAEISWGVSSDRRCRGLGTEIGWATLELAFGELDLHRAYARSRVENR
jgi:[ribosomal protein S5]-alanine N-acetyltransferase